MRISSTLSRALAVTMLASVTALAAPAPAHAVITDDVPNQAGCDNGSTTYTWSSLGLARPVVATMTVDGETVTDPANPADGKLGVAVCANVPLARKTGLTVIRRQGSSYRQDLTGALSPNGNPVTADSVITITLTDLGDNAEFFSFALVNGKVTNWTTSGLGTPSASLSFSVKPARRPLVDANAPGGQFCSATPPVCDVAQSDLDVMAVAVDMDFDRDGTFADFSGAYVSLEGAVSGFVQPGQPDGLTVSLGGPHFEDDGTTLNVGSMAMYLPDATLGAVLGIESAGLTAESLEVTRTEDGDTAAAAYTVQTVPGGAVVAIDGVTFSSPVYTVTAAGGAGFTPVVPDRILDTRPGALVGYSGAKPTAGQVIELAVAGAAGTGVPADAGAVALNVTGTEATADGFVTVWPCGVDRPQSSSLNLLRGQTTPNMVVVGIGSGGRVCLYTQSGTHLIADVTGWYPASSFEPVTPQRLLDTRPGYLVGYSGAKPVAGQTVELPVAAPAGAVAVALNVTGTEATADGFVTVWPCSAERPQASNLNLTTGQTVPNLVVVGLGGNGKVCLYTQSGTHLLADVTGFLGEPYSPVVPRRLLDTRPGYLTGYTGAKPVAGQTVELAVAELSPQSAGPGAGVVLNVTGTEATADGFVTVWPCGTERPQASNLNLTAGRTAPNLVIVGVGTGGSVCLYTQSGTHLLADVVGYLPG